MVDNETALLGRDLISALRLRIEGNTVHSPIASLFTLPSTAAVASLTTQPASSTTLGCAKGFMHQLKVAPTAVPVRQKLRRHPFSVRAAVSDELNRLLSDGVIGRIEASPWVSPIVVTQKKTGSIRMRGDFREPNKAIIVDSYPLPHMEELLTTLSGATLFSTIDLECAYHQVPLHPESRDLTAFITHEGLFRFCRIPFGLATAPAAFQRLMSTVLSGVLNVQYYLDDIICYGRTAQEHDAALKTVLQRLKDAGLHLNEKKCHFLQTSNKCNKLHPALALQDTRFRHCVPLTKRVAIALWKFATGSEYWTIAHLFGVGQTSVWTWVQDFCAAAETLLVPEQIRIPDESTFSEMAASNECRWGLPQSVGAIDGSHIPIIASTNYHTDSFNRKGWHSIILQAVVDGRGNVFTGLPGSMHDARVLRLSSLWELASRGNIFPQHTRTIGTDCWVLHPWRLSISVERVAPEAISGYCTSDSTAACFKPKIQPSKGCC